MQAPVPHRSCLDSILDEIKTSDHPILNLKLPKGRRIKKKKQFSNVIKKKKKLIIDKGYKDLINLAKISGVPDDQIREILKNSTIF